MTYVIGISCVDLKDRTCIDECPVDCIYEGDRMMYINPDECVDCGACEPVCPVEAIAYEDDLADQDKPFAGAAQQLFSELEPPQGAIVGLVPDPPFVAALPLQNHTDGEGRGAIPRPRRVRHMKRRT